MQDRALYKELIVKRISLIAAMTLISVASTGCQCLPLTERYTDVVDAYADREIALDGLYTPKLDVTRWGRWNGPQCCQPNCNCR